MDLARYIELATPILEKAGITWESQEKLEKVLSIVKPKIKSLHDLPEWVGYFFSEEFPFDEAAVTKNLSSPEAAERLKALAEALTTLESWEPAAIETRLKETAVTLGLKTGELIHPSRVAVSGRSVGAGLYETFEILGKEQTIKRLLAGAKKAL